MTDELFTALNPPRGGKLSPETCDKISARWNNLQADPLFTEGERSEIFKAFVKNIFWNEDEKIASEFEELGNNSVPPTISKKCSVCGGMALEGWKYQDQASFRIICQHCQERQRIQNRVRPSGQRTLL